MDKEKSRHRNGRPHLVFHAKEPTFWPPHPQWPEDYQLVAVVNAKTLSKVVELTNHLDHDWALNPEVCSLVAPRRSTSVGDVVVDPNGRGWCCEPVGWSEVPLLLN